MWVSMKVSEHLWGSSLRPSDYDYNGAGIGEHKKRKGAFTVTPLYFSPLWPFFPEALLG